MLFQFNVPFLYERNCTEFSWMSANDCEFYLAKNLKEGYIYKTYAITNIMELYFEYSKYLNKLINSI